MVVPSRRPSSSRAAATWRSLWVSTPMVTRGGGVCAMVVVAILSMRRGGWSHRPGGRTTLRRVWWQQAPIRSHVPGRCCCWWRPRRRADSSDSHQAVVRKASPGRDRTSVARPRPGPTDLLPGSKPVEPRVRPSPRPRDKQHGGHGSGRQIDSRARSQWVFGSGPHLDHRRDHRSGCWPPTARRPGGCRDGLSAGGIWTPACRGLSGSGRLARPPFGAHADRVQAGPGPVGLAPPAELVQELMVEALPHAGALPVAQPPPASDRATTTQLPGGQQPPGDAGAQLIHDAGQCGAIVDARPAAVAAWWWGRQRLDRLPELLGHKGFGRDGHGPNSAHDHPQPQESVEGRKQALIGGSFTTCSADHEGYLATEGAGSGGRGNILCSSASTGSPGRSLITVGSLLTVLDRVLLLARLPGGAAPSRESRRASGSS